MIVGGNLQVGAVSSFSVKEIEGSGLGGRRVDVQAVNDVGLDFNANEHSVQVIITPDGRIKVTVDTVEIHNTVDE